MNNQIYPANGQSPSAYSPQQQQQMVMMPGSAAGGAVQMSPQQYQPLVQQYQPLVQQDHQQPHTMFVAPVTPQRMNANMIAITLDTDETILKTFTAKEGFCHVCLPADETAQTVLTNKRLATSSVDNDYVCLCIPSGEYTRISDTYDLKDVVHISSDVTNVGWCGLTAIFKNLFSPPAAKINVSISRESSVVGWMSPGSGSVQGFETLLCCMLGCPCLGVLMAAKNKMSENRWETNRVTGKVVRCYVERQELQSVVMELQKAVMDINKQQ